jgi:HEAT repeat protein
VNDSEISPEQAIREFYSSDRAEDQMMDPLILAGEEVVPLLLIEIEKKTRPQRRYAIGALGNIQDKSALSVLEEILGDEAEEDYFRCDALNSIGMIDFRRGRELAARERGSSVECLSELSSLILTTSKEDWLDDNYMRRTRHDAQLGRHE